jgi:membrane protein implicated in regulation of membrane protease activity
MYKTEDVISAKPVADYPLISLYASLIFLAFLLVFTLLILNQQVKKRKEQEKENENENLS